MKRSDVLKTLKLLSSGLGGESLPEVFRCFCFDKTVVYSNNDKIVISGDNPISGFSGVVNGKALLGSLDNSSADEITVISTNPLELQLDKAEIKLPGLSLEAQPITCTTPPDIFLSNNLGFINEFIDALVINEISLDSRGGVTLTQENNKSVLYSTDTVSISRVELVENLNLNQPVTLSAEFVYQFLGLAKKLNVLSISSSSPSTTVLFENNYKLVGRNIFTPKIELLQKYVQAAKIDSEKSSSIKIPDNLLQVLSRAMIIAENDNLVRLTVDKNLTISAKTSKGQFKESLDIDSYPVVDIKIDVKKLIAGLKLNPTKLQINELFVNLSGDNFNYLIAPYAV